jgi:hypothetical protein
MSAAPTCRARAASRARSMRHLEVRAVWMNCAMNPKHPQAKKTHKLRRVAATAMRGLAALGPGIGARAEELLSVFQINNAGAMETLRKTLLKGKEPTYVHAGQTNETHHIKLDKAKIHVLGPESDFDHFYLGKAADGALKSALAAAGLDVEEEDGIATEDNAVQPADVTAVKLPLPSNISPAAFRALCARMQSNALAFAELDGKLKNNSSVVLLIEWNGKRLLFVGDAEWSSAFKDGKMNGAWNVMWKERKGLLGKPVDFLKVGHHGSENATPWDMGKGTATEASEILDAILPLPAGGRAPTARAVVSTERGKYRTIPRALLMTEIAGRVQNSRVMLPISRGSRRRTRPILTNSSASGSTRRSLCAPTSNESGNQPASST